jgi:hypothetical protein
MEYMDKYENLLKIITEEIELDIDEKTGKGKKYNLKDDFEKFFIKGNRTAGTRIRRIMQEIKKSSQEIRDNVQEYKSKI